MKKNDWLLAAGIIISAVAVLIVQLIPFSGGTQTVTVSVGGKNYGEYSISGQETIEIGDTNRIQIENGTVWMEWADCPDQVCVHHRKISHSGESIICLPNEVVVSIEGGDRKELDGIAQ